VLSLGATERINHIKRTEKQRISREQKKHNKVIDVELLV
jgi:hypothetical protein